LETGVATERDDTEGAAYVGWSREAFYGRFMETGTKKMPARPHIRPGFEQKKEQVARAMLDVLRGEMEE
jgi:HK97 gp10 family phage protein